MDSLSLTPTTPLHTTRTHASATTHKPQLLPHTPHTHSSSLLTRPLPCTHCPLADPPSPRPTLTLPLPPPLPHPPMYASESARLSLSSCPLLVLLLLLPLLCAGQSFPAGCSAALGDDVFAGSTVTTTPPDGSADYLVDPTFTFYATATGPVALFYIYIAASPAFSEFQPTLYDSTGNTVVDRGYNTNVPAISSPTVLTVPSSENGFITQGHQYKLTLLFDVITRTPPHISSSRLQSTTPHPLSKSAHPSHPTCSYCSLSLLLCVARCSCRTGTWPLQLLH